MNYNEIFYSLNECFYVFAQEVLLEKFRGKSLLELMEFSWESESQIKEYLMTNNEFAQEWRKTFKKNETLIQTIVEATKDNAFEITKRFITKVITEMKIRLP